MSRGSVGILRACRVLGLLGLLRGVRIFKCVSIDNDDDSWEYKYDVNVIFDKYLHTDLMLHGLRNKSFRYIQRKIARHLSQLPKTPRGI